MGGKPVTPQAKKYSLFGLIFTHLQVVVGLIVYFFSQKVRFDSTTMSDPLARFFTMEHTVMMLIAVILITIGHRQTKAGNGRKMFWFYFIALLVIIACYSMAIQSCIGWKLVLNK
jgi:mannose/fructose/N-acetylgalactosamine-specific phosphotransferase system component IIC